MASDAENEPTQTQSQSNDVDTNGWELRESESEIWGRLIAMNKILQDVDISNTTFSVGRQADGNNYCFRESLGKKMFTQLSKTHFKLTKDLSNMLNPVYITDCSRNGTYVNQEKIGQGNKRILNHNDVIAVTHPAYRVFRFRDAHRGSLELPDAIKKKYYVGKKLGEGACGQVYMAFDCITCEPYALKQIKKHQLNGYKKEKAKNEGDIMKTIKHPCVVKMHGVHDIDDSMYITLELMKGGDLLHRIQQKVYLEESISKLFFYQMCHAVKYLHDRKITHRDLKPDNILLASSQPETLVKISDFGLSKVCQDNSVLRTMCGTPHYVAPEVLLTNGRGEYTQKVDVWSLGVVLYTCLSGTLPFSNDYGSPATEQIKKADFRYRGEHWRHVSAMAKRLVGQMLTVDVKKRLSVEQLLNHEWLNDYEMKTKAHKIMKIAPPAKLFVNNVPAHTHARGHNFIVPYRVEEIRPSNDENAQPMKKRRIN